MRPIKVIILITFAHDKHRIVHIYVSYFTYTLYIHAYKYDNYMIAEDRNWTRPTRMVWCAWWFRWLKFAIDTAKHNAIMLLGRAIIFREARNSL